MRFILTFLIVASSIPLFADGADATAQGKRAIIVFGYQGTGVSTVSNLFFHRNKVSLSQEDLLAPFVTCKSHLDPCTKESVTILFSEEWAVVDARIDVDRRVKEGRMPPLLRELLEKINDHKLRPSVLVAVISTRAEAHILKAASQLQKLYPDAPLVSVRTYDPRDENLRQDDKDFRSHGAIPKAIIGLRLKDHSNLVGRAPDTLFAKLYEAGVFTDEKVRASVPTTVEEEPSVKDTMCEVSIEKNDGQNFIIIRDKVTSYKLFEINKHNSDAYLKIYRNDSAEFIQKKLEIDDIVKFISTIGYPEMKVELYINNEKFREIPFPTQASSIVIKLLYDFL